ncbi:MAG: beta-propeller domain-containing protein [Verrucomicrobia bacterium]|nr:beta-propeller domain-containing protein [Verrucomicrobiota bacterium]
MKTQPLFIPGSAWKLSVCAALAAAFSAVAQGERPVIESIRLEQTDVVVRVQVPAGIHEVTLESRDRVSRQAWEPRAVARTDGTGGRIVFRLTRSSVLELMRVRGEPNPALPAMFFTGTNSFDGEVIVTSEGTDPAAYDATRWTSDVLYTTTTSPVAPGTTENSAREVVESDIWAFRGPTLYFFNQYRGLQIIDVSDPDAARVRGALELPAAGEQMYLLGADHVVLLVRDGCDYSRSRVLVVADQAGGPVVTATLPVDGSLQESRMVGTVLYVASQHARYVNNTDRTTVEWGTQVSAFDLSDPAAPVARNTLWYAGYGNVVAATDVLFLVVTYPDGYYACTVNLVDITSPDGTMRAYGAVRPAGRVQDKFKLHYDRSVLTTIAESQGTTGTTRIVTRLQTFRVPHPLSMGPVGIAPLGQLELGQNERLRATRFDGDRVYVVTFFQIDPLWVVSLANPARPAIVGSVEIPGWSTYLEPLGDHLVSVGVETNRVAVSLFDVSNPAQPALASRVLLGETHSWSEANWDEKAFAVLPGANLILVPFNGDVTNRYVSAVQLIDLKPGALAARGQIAGAFAFRRATAYDDRLLALSGWELQTVDATDRDHPALTHRLQLAWTADRVFLAGDYLLQIQEGNSWDSYSGPSVRVTLASEPHHLLGELTLTNLPVLGATLRENRLYIAQGESAWCYPIPLADAADRTVKPLPPNFVLTVVSLDALPALSVAGQAGAFIASLGWRGTWQAVWPSPNLLVWAGGGHAYSWRWYEPWLMPAIPLDIAVAGTSLVWWPYGGGSGGRLVAFDVRDASAPQVASKLNLGANTWWNFSRAFAANGMVYLSHEHYQRWYPLHLPTTDPTAAVGDTSTVSSTSGTSPTCWYWMRRTFLDVIDYADPADPLVRRPVNLPGTLAGVSASGRIVFTTGPRWSANSTTRGAEYLDALAYDGVSAHRMAELPLPEAWPHSVRIAGMNIFLGRPAVSGNSADASPNFLENWHLSAAGAFEQLSRVPLAKPVSALADFGALLAAQENDGTFNLFAVGNATGLALIGRAQPAGCGWYDLGGADGDLTRGLWVPMGAYGVACIPVSR